MDQSITSTSSQEQVSCPNCQFLSEIGANLCGKCGTELKTVDDNSKTASIQVTEWFKIQWAKIVSRPRSSSPSEVVSLDDASDTEQEPGLITDVVIAEVEQSEQIEEINTSDSQIDIKEDYRPYPTDLWDYIDDIPYMPSRKDRDELERLAAIQPVEAKRLKIWEYFFRLDPEDVGEPQRREIDKREKELTDKKEHYEYIVRTENQKIEKLRQEFDEHKNKYEGRNETSDRIKELELKIKENTQYYNRLRLFLVGIASFIGIVVFIIPRVFFYLSQSLSTETFQVGTLVSTIIGPLMWCTGPLIFFGLMGLETYRVIRPIPERKELLDEKHKLEESILDYETRAKEVQAEIKSREGSLQTAKTEYEAEVVRINERIADLNSMIEALKVQIPSPSADDTIRQWLDEDLASLRESSLVQTSLSTQLEPIDFVDEEGTEVKNSNPLPFVYPGELQDPDYIPPPYRPVRETIVQNIAAHADANFKSSNMDQSLLPEQLARLFKTDNSHNILNAVRPTPNSDRAKHLLARQMALTSDRGYEILFGVYYIEYIMVTDDMITIHGFFFDFITGKTTADKITEQYYRDVVAIEQSKDFRVIPIRVNNADPSNVRAEETLEIEDAPTFSLTLPSGEKRKVTFVNEDYLEGLVVKMGEELTEEKRQDIKRICNEANQIAENTFKVLRFRLRQHKTKPETMV